MNHCGTQLIETERLILRRFTADDAEAMYYNWASDEEVTTYLMWTPHKDVDESRRILGEWIPCYEQDNYYNWGICLKDRDNELVGNIAVVILEEETSKCHIGYCIGKDWWHQGITSEALKAVMDYLFDTVGANRIESRHDPRNPNSGKVMQKCGMKYEGTMRASDWNNQGICDACYYALLRSER